MCLQIHIIAVRRVAAIIRAAIFHVLMGRLFMAPKALFGVERFVAAVQIARVPNTFMFTGHMDSTVFLSCKRRSTVLEFAFISHAQMYTIHMYIEASSISKNFVTVRTIMRRKDIGHIKDILYYRSNQSEGKKVKRQTGDFCHAKQQRKVSCCELQECHSNA
jgi:CTP synthase (UTP-ammonia lyase)